MRTNKLYRIIVGTVVEKAIFSEHFGEKSSIRDYRDDFYEQFEDTGLDFFDGHENLDDNNMVVIGKQVLSDSKWDTSKVVRDVLALYRKNKSEVKKSFSNINFLCDDAEVGIYFVVDIL